MDTFVHLHTHSEYSLVDGLLRIKPFIKSVKANGMPAVALTDQNNLFALVKFYRAALAEGVKPIIGCDAFLQDPKKPLVFYRFTLLCRNEAGYKALSHLISKAYLENQVNQLPVIKREWLTPEHCQNLLAISGGIEGELGSALVNGQQKSIPEIIEFWKRSFPNTFFIELSRVGRQNEEEYIQLALDISEEHQIPVVATNNVCFLEESDFGAHEARVCIASGYVLDDQKRLKRHTAQQYLRSPEDMHKLFADIPEAISNTQMIAKLCNVELTIGENFLPNYPTPDNQSIEDYLRMLSQQGLEMRYERDLDLDEPEKAKYQERLEIELDVIITMGFPGYFLIVADFIHWSKENNIPVGPGRGSGAGSLVAYALEITDVDPIEFDLLFERFLNPERVSMPDFDIDFCMEGRDRVIDYVAQKYGRESVSQIITYGRMAAKAVVRDVGRVLGHPYGFVDKIAKLIPFELGITLDKALDDSEVLLDLYQTDDKVRALIDLAKKLEGVARNAGKHAGGVVIAPTVLTDFTPIYCEPGGTNAVSQLDKDDVEAIGLVKFDFLGLRTLTIIDWAVQSVNKLHKAEKPLDISHIPINDVKTFDLIKAGQTTAVFQLESRGMKELIMRLQPDCFEDIVALVALFRPGPLQSGMVDDFIDRKHGRAEIEYPHPDLEPILKPTYGVILYQEQVMQIAQVLAGYSLGGADLLRRAMGKKKVEEMAKQRDLFLEGSGKNGVDAKLANSIFDLMEKFAGYGFNKSHSVAYALLAYQTAWLKAHYPAEFMSAVLSSDMDNTDKVVNFIDDCKAMELEIAPPHVNHSDYQFVPETDTKIIYGLGAIKGAGQAAIEHIAEVRRANGEYSNLFDFCRRMDLQKINKRVLESLIYSGAMDKLGPNRASLLASLQTAISVSQQNAKNQQTGQFDMFSDDEQVVEQTNTAFVEVEAWSETQRLRHERETLGFYLTGHPITQFRDELKALGAHRLGQLKSSTETVKVAGLVLGVKVMKTKKGNRMAFLTLDDQTGRLEIVVFSDTYETYYELLTKDAILLCEGEVSEDDFTGGLKMVVQSISTLEQARVRRGKHIQLKVSLDEVDSSFVQKLEQIISPHCPGKCPIKLSFDNQEIAADVVLGEHWHAQPHQDLLDKLKRAIGKDRVLMVYDN